MDCIRSNDKYIRVCRLIGCSWQVLSAVKHALLLFSVVFKPKCKTGCRKVSNISFKILYTKLNKNPFNENASGLRRMELHTNYYTSELFVMRAQ